jgi:hypothetical protein
MGWVRLRALARARPVLHAQKETRFVKRYLLSLGALMTAVAAFALPASADQPAVADQVAQAAPAPSPSPSPTPAPKAFQPSAYLDSGYDSANATGPKGLLNGRVFDNVAGTPQVNDFNVTLAYNAPLGGKLELNTGTDADVIHSWPQSLYICTGGLVGIGCVAPYAIQTDITQAYASFGFGKFTIIGGKFETLAGAEVIESPSDLNFSRSILFGYAVPFTHTGVRLTYAATPTLNVIVGANRGWDTTHALSAATEYKLGYPAADAPDTNSLTAEYGVAFTPNSIWNFTLQGYDGKQEDWLASGCNTSTTCTRSLIDFVGTWHINSALTGTVNVDDGQQTNTASGAFLSGVGTVTWKGVAGYLSEAFSPALTTTVRYESFGDPQGYRSGYGAGVTWNEGTLTAQYAANAHITLRAEYRVDTATAPIFLNKGGNGPGQKVLNTLGLEGIVHVP